MMEKKKEAEKLKHFRELYEMEQNMRKQKKQEEKRNIMKVYQFKNNLQGWGVNFLFHPGSRWQTGSIFPKANNEEELISKAAAEAVAKQDKQQREKKKKKVAMLRSIAENRKAVQK
ncbi:hypothetical protein KOW79_002554 [Hemibagrus wyckioides]|uniref:Uncharacterized protein n=1 Tax=Hemibagrus wyckioides TaxID=337641 RepID=A0A9D3SRP3_9TELE|nr:hypothetical protein KOW79_002554 [Hemibagrus wyckioides]